MPSVLLAPLRTARLILEEFTHEDITSYHELESLPEVVRYQTWHPRTLAESSTAVHEIVEAQTARPRPFIELAVRTSDDQTFIGRVGAAFDYDNKTASLWFSFIPTAQKKGYASEAMKAMIPFVLEVAEDRQLGEAKGLQRLEIECDPRNEGSWKLAERLGFARVSLTEKAFECKGEWVDSLVYSKLA
jgi:RimJ/RimL family protein N-acetyltransferase